MTIEQTGASAPAPNATPSGDTASAIHAAPAPGSAEHRAAMIAAYDAQFVQTSVGTDVNAKGLAPAATQAETAAQEPKAPETPKVEEPKVDETPAEGEAKPDDKSGEVTLGTLIESGDLFTALSAEKVPEDVLGQFKKLGATDDQIAGLSARVRGLLALEAQVALDKVHTLAGGKDAFEALNAWGHKNLTQTQRDFYNSELSGPNAADVMALLKQRMNAGREPQLHNVTGQPTPTAQGFRDKTEMTAAMSNPLYQTSEAYRAEVVAKLRASRF